MRTRTITTLLAAVVVALAGPLPAAGSLDGTVKLGNVWLEKEDGDRSAVQETYNVHDGFAISQVRLDGRNPRHAFSLDLRDINLDSRQGDFVYRAPGIFKLTAGYDQSRYVFDPARLTNSERKDLRLGAMLTTGRWFSLSGSFGRLERTGDRLVFPAGPVSPLLGTGYDNVLLAGHVGAEIRGDRRGLAFAYRVSDYSDDRNAENDRLGHLVSGRLWLPTPSFDRWTHMLRAAYGERRQTDRSLDYELAQFQYTSILDPMERVQLKYNFEAQRIDHQGTGLKTDRFQNDLDLVLGHAYGRVTAGYGYEMNDDDRSLTHYNSFRAGATFRYERRISAKLDFASRTKTDTEELTLLKDVESSRIRGTLQLEPVDGFALGGRYAKRERELPDIDVKFDGEVMGGFGRCEVAKWGSLSADYNYATDEYTDLAAGYEVSSHIVTGRAEITRFRNLRLAGGATYMDIGRDLDIEKSMVFGEAAYRFLKDYQLEVRYNVYNYDDYILLDRYYTANVIRVNLAYDLHL